MRLAWITDPHFNDVPEERWEPWIDEVSEHGVDGIVISGDISEGDDVVPQLDRIARSLAVPISFVLGNHDFYRNSIAATRQQVIAASRESDQLQYLTDASPMKVARQTYLVGEDGWCDATIGDYENSTIRLKDFEQIEDFRDGDQAEWKQQLQELGAESAARLRQKLSDLPPKAKAVLVVTHVPPFRDACWYEGRTTDDNWAPFFVCGQVGRVLREVSLSRPACQFRVLCGHTHHRGVAKLTPNLIVHTGGSAHGEPGIEGLVSIGAGKIEIS